MDDSAACIERREDGAIIALDLGDLWAPPDFDGSWLADLAALEELSMPQFEDSPGRLVLPALAKCPALHTFSASAPDGIDLEVFRHSHLASLTLGGFIERVDLSPLADCPSLTALRLGRNCIGELDLAPLASCRQLRTLDLAAMSDVDPKEEFRLKHLDLTPLASCELLEELLLGGNSLREIDLRPLAALRHLRVLTLWDNMFTTLDLAPLAGAASLEDLNLDYCLSYYYPATMTAPLEAIDLGPLATCRALKRFQIGSGRLRELDLGPLAGAPIQHLRISGARLGAVDLTALAHVTTLRTLDLGGHDWLDLELSPLAHLPELDTLRVRARALSTLELAPLATLPKLRDLYLAASPADAGSPALAPLSRCRHLERLMIEGRAVGSLDLTEIAGAPLTWLNLFAYNPGAPMDLRPLLACERLGEVLLAPGVAADLSELTQALSRPPPWLARLLPRGGRRAVPPTKK